MITKKESLDSVLSEAEKVQLEALNEKPEMMSALRKVLLSAVAVQGVAVAGKEFEPSYNAAFSLVSNEPNTSNEILGENLRGLWSGTQLMIIAFEDLKLYKKAKEQKGEKINPAL